MKRLLVLAMAAMLVVAMVSLTGCGEKESTESGNPVISATESEVLDATGVDLAAPEGATDVEYSYIEGTEGEESATAQVEFVLDDLKYCYRAKSVGITSITGNIPDDADEEDLTAGIDAAVETGTTISGMYYDWEASALTEVRERAGVVCFNDGHEGFIAWLDVVPGILYSLSMEDGTSQDLLTETAEKIFVEAQGDSE